MDPLGRLPGATEMDEVVARSFEVRTADVTTPYLLLGDWVGAASVLLVVGILAAGALRRRSVVRAPARR